MAESESTVTIRAELQSDIPQKAAESAGALDLLADAAKHLDSAATTLGQVGTQMDKTNQRTKELGTSLTPLSKTMKEVNEQGLKMREGFVGIGDSVKERLTYPLQQLTWVLEGAIAGMVTFGLVSYANLQTAGIQLSAFTGSATAGSSALAALMGIRSSTDLAPLQSTWEQLQQQGGFSGSQAMRLTRALSNENAVLGDKTGAQIGTDSGILSQVNQKYGVISGTQIQQLAALNPAIYSWIAQSMGISVSALKRDIALNPSSSFRDANLISQVEGSRSARDGASIYDASLAGQFTMLKRSAADALAVVESPLVPFLTRETNKVSSWAQATEARFKVSGGSLGSDLSSGNYGGFSTTLGAILGDPKLDPAIKLVTKDLDDLSRIVTGSLIPAGLGILRDFEPAIKLLSDALDFLAQHRTTTELMITTLAGFLVASKLAQWGSAGAAGIRALSVAFDSGLPGLLAYGRGLMGLKTAEEGAAAGEAAEGAGAGLAAGEGGAAALGLGGTAGLAGLAIGGGAALAMLANSGLSKANTRGTLSGPHITAKQASNISSEVATIQNLHLTNNITIPGSGNPEKVANTAARNINETIAAAAARTARRSGHPNSSAVAAARMH
jgi:hypothetical protein